MELVGGSGAGPCGRRHLTVRVHFLLVRRVPPVPSPVLVEVGERLRRRGFVVTGVIPEEVLTSVDELDLADGLVVLKSHTELALSLAAGYHAGGARLLNPFESCVITQDKVTACQRLRAAGVPVPMTWVTADPSLVAGLLDRGPLVLKPLRGHRGAGVRVVHRLRDLEVMPAAADVPFVVQEFVPGPGEDLKVYVAGEHVHAVRKPFSAESFTHPGRSVALDPEVRQVAVRCGEALGLGLYGVDVIEGADGPVAVDVNYFPGYKGVPAAAGPIADYIERYASGDIGLVPGGRGQGEAVLA